MKAGALRDRVTVRVQAPAAGGNYGQISKPYSDGATLWAAIRSPMGRESVAAGQTTAQLTHVVEVRYPGSAVLATLIPSNQLRIFGTTRDLNIVSVADPDGRKRRLRILCSEVIEPTAPTYPAAGGG